MLSIGLAHLKLDQVKRRKGARGKENAKRRRNTWIVTTRAIPTVMLQEVLEKHIYHKTFNDHDIVYISSSFYVFQSFFFSSVEYL